MSSPIFLGDLTKCMSVVIDDSNIKKLKNQAWLGTTLVDYPIQYSFFLQPTVFFHCLIW
jgi:hypothetical protein